MLRSIDQQIGRLHRAAQLAPREYHLVCLSDHGQTQGESFATRFGETVEQLVGRLCGGQPPRGKQSPSRRAAEGWQVASALAEATAGGGPIARRLRARVERSDPSTPATPAGDHGEASSVAGS